MINFGDVIFQLFSVLIPICLIFVIVYYFRSTKNRNHRIENLEAKVEELLSKEREER